MAPDDGWSYHPKHVQQFPDLNKLCEVALSPFSLVRSIEELLE